MSQNNIPIDSRPIANVLIKDFAIALSSSIFMFFERGRTNILFETMQETLELDKEIRSISSKTTIDEKRLRVKFIGYIEGLMDVEHNSPYLFKNSSMFRLFFFIFFCFSTY